MPELVTAVTKYCRFCERDLPIDQFAPYNKSEPDKRYSKCRNCNKKACAAWHAKNRDRRKRYRDNNAARIKDVRRAYKQQQKVNSRDWHQRNLIRARELGRRWVENNPEQAKEIKRRSRASHRDTGTRATQQYRARRAEVSTQAFSSDDLIGYWRANSIDPDRCIYCGGPHEHDDHVIPISRGGPHCLENLVPACTACNCSKGNKFVEEWLIDA